MRGNTFCRAASLVGIALLAVNFGIAQVAENQAYSVDFLGTTVEFTPGNAQGVSPLTFNGQGKAVEGAVMKPAVLPARSPQVLLPGGEASGIYLEGGEPPLSVLVGPDGSNPVATTVGDPTPSSAAPLIPEGDDGAIASLLMNDIRRIYGFTQENVDEMLVPWINEPGDDPACRRLRDEVAAALENCENLDDVSSGTKARIAVRFHEAYSARCNRGEIEPRNYSSNHSILYVKEELQNLEANQAAQVNSQANSGLALRGAPWGDGAGGRLRSGDPVTVLQRSVDEAGTPWYLVKDLATGKQGWVVGYWIEGR